ncbi:hypothetical protein [Nocardioides sambongensis]|uniref:hypothetical protein n=1 Tax=Nocardioides sambongensis TaxID=2589074 RepID=UPI0015E84B68|nr:hypothetical protein [Nocardioides sambongensis]
MSTSRAPRTASPRRAFRLTAAATCVGLSTSLVAGVGLAGPAHAAPVEDCAEAFPVADLVAGDEVDGLTVSSATTPSPSAARCSASSPTASAPVGTW